MQQKICLEYGSACLTKTENLLSADYLDLDFDTISQALILTTFRHEPSNSMTGWLEQIENYDGAAKVEVGILANEKPIEQEELSLGGFLSIIGEDEKPSRQPPIEK